MLINLTPHPIRIYPYGTPDRIDPDDYEPEMVLEPADQPARIGENYLHTQTMPHCPARVAHIEFRHTTGLPPFDDDPRDIRTWYVVSLPLALTLAGKRPDLLAPHMEVRNMEGTLTSSTALKGGDSSLCSEGFLLQRRLPAGHTPLRSYIGSTGQHGEPRRFDVDRRVHVAVVDCATRARPLPDAQRHLALHGPARRAQLAAGIPTVDHD